MKRKRRKIIKSWNKIWTKNKIKSKRSKVELIIVRRRREVKEEEEDDKDSEEDEDEEDPEEEEEERLSEPFKDSEGTVREKSIPSYGRSCVTNRSFVSKFGTFEEWEERREAEREDTGRLEVESEKEEIVSNLLLPFPFPEIASWIV